MAKVVPGSHGPMVGEGQTAPLAPITTGAHCQPCCPADENVTVIVAPSIGLANEYTCTNTASTPALLLLTVVCVGSTLTTTASVWQSGPGAQLAPLAGAGVAVGEG